MQIRNFRARNVAQAMQQVRAQLGPDALILSTRQVAGGVEIAAATEPPRRDAAAPPLSPLPAALAYHAVPPFLAQRLHAAPLPEALADALRFAALPLADGASPILFAGPPGAGKTLTVARLATRLVFSGILPVVVTTDAQRAGGGEQLSAFTRLLGITLITAASPPALQEALRPRCARAPVLIDLAGGTPFHHDARQELTALAQAAGGTLAVVLPAGLDANESADLALGYRECGARHLIATRLDLARRIGGVLAAAASGLALAEAGIGPGAADGMVPMTATLLATYVARMPPRDSPEGRT